MITHRLKVTEDRTIERLDHKPIVAKSNGADFVQFTFENPSEWTITGVLVVYMFNGTPYGSCVIDKDSDGNPLALTENDGVWQLTAPIPYQCITSEGYLYTGLSLFRTDVDASTSSDTTPHIIAKLSTALLSQPIQILKNGGLDEIDVAASPNDDLLVRMKLFIESFSTEWMENVDKKFDNLDKTISGDSETGGGLIADITTNANNIIGLQERIDELNTDVDALDVVVNGSEAIVDDSGSVEQEAVKGLVELQKEDAENIQGIIDSVMEDIIPTVQTQADKLEELQTEVENIVVDEEFSNTSTNAIQNKTLTEFLTGLNHEVVMTTFMEAVIDRFTLGVLFSQQQLSMQNGELSKQGKLKEIGSLRFDAMRFTNSSSNTSRPYISLHDDQIFTSVKVDTPASDDNSSLVPNTEWVNNRIDSLSAEGASLVGKSYFLNITMTPGLGIHRASDFRNVLVIQRTEDCQTEITSNYPDGLIQIDKCIDDGALSANILSSDYKFLVSGYVESRLVNNKYWGTDWMKRIRLELEDNYADNYQNSDVSAKAPVYWHSESYDGIDGFGVMYIFGEKSIATAYKYDDAEWTDDDVAALDATKIDISIEYNLIITLTDYVPTE